jgi:membrane protease YdiL (CAAX protease family)
VKALGKTEEKRVVSPLEAIVAIILTFVFSIFSGAFLLQFFGTEITLVLGEVLLIVIPLVVMLGKGVNIRSYIGLKISPKYILLGIAFGAFLFLLDLVVTNILISVFGVSQAVEESNKLISDLSGSPEGLFAVTLSLLLAGICEEFTFRGFLLTSINSKYSFGTALIVSSLAFGLFHFDPQVVYTASAFAIGLVLGYVYHHWHSYVVSATAHATLNLIALALFLLPR